MTNFIQKMRLDIGFSDFNCLLDSQCSLLTSQILGRCIKLKWSNRAYAVYWLCGTLLCPWNLVLRNLELIEKQVWDSCQEYCILSPSCHPENATGVSKLVVVQTNSILKEELEIFSRVLSPTIVSLKESGEWSLNRFVKKRKDEQKNTCVSNN